MHDQKSFNRFEPTDAPWYDQEKKRWFMNVRDNRDAGGDTTVSGKNASEAKMSAIREAQMRNLQQ